MLYSFFNFGLALVIILALAFYFQDKKNMLSFIIILFNMNVAFYLLWSGDNILFLIFIALISIIIYHFFGLFQKSKQEIILIQHGNICFKEVIEYFGLDKLMLELKLRRVKLDEIEYALLIGKHLTIIKNKESNYPVNLIVHGELLTYNLKMIGKKEGWLKEELLRNHLLIKNVMYAYYLNKQVYFVKE